MRKRITPAMIVALIALFAALAGTATAAGTAVLITSKQIKDGSIQLADMSPTTKKALKGERGPRGYTGFTGLTGPQGLQGAQGPAGGFDPNKVTYVQGTPFSIAPGAIGSGATHCPLGAKAISGGWTVIAGGGGEVWGSRSYDSGGSWTVMVTNHGEYTNADITPFAICAAR